LKKIIFFTLLLALLTSSVCPKKNSTCMASYSLLALGDSYTIGESVLLTESFPYQTTALLRGQGFDFYAPEIIAKTGWTTDELQAAIDGHIFRKEYDFVTLLIGVNNQYRGRSVDGYKPELEKLLQQAIRFAGNNPARVIVVSIPDWGVTPFAEGRNREQIAKEIDAYNLAAKTIAEKYGSPCAYITANSRDAAHDLSLVAADGLHPSAKEYHRWAMQVAGIIQETLNRH
jgi:lysophospholipase L1-like esterase